MADDQIENMIHGHTLKYKRTRIHSSEANTIVHIKHLEKRFTLLQA